MKTTAREEKMSHKKQFYRKKIVSHLFPQKKYVNIEKRKLLLPTRK